MKGLTEGRKVHYVMPDNTHRSADVVHAGEAPETEGVGLANLYVFLDGQNDAAWMVGYPQPIAPGVPILWATSVHYDANKAAGTWHWPEQV